MQIDLLYICEFDYVFQCRLFYAANFWLNMVSSTSHGRL